METDLRRRLVRANGIRVSTGDCPPPLEYIPLGRHQGLPNKGTLNNLSKPRWHKRIRFDEGYNQQEPDPRTLFSVTRGADKPKMDPSVLVSATRNVEEEMRREVVRLNAEYREKLEAIDVWRSTELDDIHQRYEEKKRRAEEEFKAKWSGNMVYHTFLSNQFQVENGNTACSSISLMAVYNFLRVEKRDPIHVNWKRVVTNGALLWNDWKRYQTNRSYQDVHEAFHVSSIKKIRETIEIRREEGGHLDADKAEMFGAPVVAANPYFVEEEEEEEDTSFHTVKQVLTILENEGQHNGTSAATFTIRENTVSLFYEPGKFWIFDSHGGVEEKKSTLIECSGIDAACAYLTHKYPLVTLEENDLDISMEHHDMNMFFMVFFRKISEPIHDIT